MTPRSSIEEVLRGLEPFMLPGPVYELRSPNTRRGTLSGYFDDPSKLARAASGIAGSEVFITVNPVQPAVAARAMHRLKEFAKYTTSDDEICQRNWILLDFDPRRPAGISSTDHEHAGALARAKECRAALLSDGFPPDSLVLADSGNGSHLLVRVDLPNDRAAHLLVASFIRALAFRFTDDVVVVDTSTANAARLRKLYGTLACKGESTSDRPHRLSGLIIVPPQIVCADTSLLEHVVRGLPQEPPVASSRRRPPTPPDVGDYLRKTFPGGDIREGEWHGGRKWVFATCPFNAEHTNSSAYVIEFPSGAISAGCHHQSCSWTWKDLRAVVDGGSRTERRAALTVVGRDPVTMTAAGASEERHNGHDDH
jgi:hypothetical protein